MEVLSVKNLSFTYPDGFRLNNISFSVEEGELLLITGPCGCGKTTLLSLLKPEISPKGMVEGSINTKYDSCRTGIVFQNPDAGIVCQKVREELVFGAENLGIKRDEMKRSLAEISAYLGIEKYINKLTSELSGGMKRVINLAAALMMNPRIILLDEPTKGLDPVASTDFYNLLLKLKEELAVTFIVVEHKLDKLIRHADKVLYLEKGEQLYLGKAQEFCRFLLDEKRAFRSSLPATVTLSNNPACFTVRELFGMLDKKTIEATIEKRSVLGGETVLKVKNGYYRYEKKQADVLRNINIEFKAGNVYGIVGGNGVGKSTLLSILLGYRKLYAGKLISNGGVAYLPQNVSLSFSKDVLLDDYLSIASKEEIEEKLTQYAFAHDIKDYLLRNPLDLSGGQMQKAAIFKMLLNGADIYLFDEPVNGLDGAEKEGFLQIVKALRDSGRTVILVSHDLEFVEKSCDKVLFMFDGEILCEENPEEAFAHNRFYTTVRGRLKGLTDYE